MHPLMQRIGIFLSLLLAAVCGASAYHSFTHNVAQAETSPVPIMSEAPSTTYICPMHSHVVQDHPGTCPICGMNLVAAEANKQAEVVVDSATRQKLGVRVAAAAEKKLMREVQTHGIVAIDPSSITHLSPKYEGWIRKLHVKAVGKQVRAGDVIYEIYSPELIVRQRDYLKLVERRIQLRKMLPDPGATENETVMMLAQEGMRARQRLFYEDLDPLVLREIESRKEPLDIVPVRAPRDGIVTEIGAREGSFVNSEMNVVSLANVARVWIDIALYEDQLQWVHDGDEVSARVDDPAVPEFTGRLHIVNTLLDPETRTATARLEVDNAHNLLRPGQYAAINVKAQVRKTLAVPRTALLRTGDGEYVMRQAGDSRFVPTPVHAGIESAAWVEIRDGLHDGDEVAVNGQFLLAAEASIQDALARAAAPSP